MIYVLLIETMSSISNLTMPTRGQAFHRDLDDAATASKVKVWNNPILNS